MNSPTVSRRAVGIAILALAAAGPTAAVALTNADPAPSDVVVGRGGGAGKVNVQDLSRQAPPTTPAAAAGEGVEPVRPQGAATPSSAGKTLKTRTKSNTANERSAAQITQPRDPASGQATGRRAQAATDGCPPPGAAGAQRDAGAKRKPRTNAEADCPPPAPQARMAITEKGTAGTKSTPPKK